MDKFQKWVNDQKTSSLVVNLLVLIQKIKPLAEVSITLLELLYLKDHPAEKETTTITNIADQVIEKTSKQNQNNKDRLAIAVNFLKQLQEEIEGDLSGDKFLDEHDQKKLESMRKRGEVLSNFYNFIIILTIIIAIVGIILIFLGLKTIGFITGVLDILPATAIVLINNAHKQLLSEENRLTDGLRKARENNQQKVDTLLAINRTIIIDDDDKRNDAIVQLTYSLSQRRLIS